MQFKWLNGHVTLSFHMFLKLGISIHKMYSIGLKMKPYN